MTAVLLAAILATLGVGGPVGPAHAEEAFAIGSTSVTFLGHGYGHGRGLSQWGAHGAALQGLTAEQILDFYYPGTTRSALTDTGLRVTLSTGIPGLLAVDARGAMRVDVAGTSTPLPRTIPTSGRTVTAWRLRPSPTAPGLLLDRWEYGAPEWIPHADLSASSAALASDAGQTRLIRPDGSRRAYRGSLQAVRSASAISTVNLVAMEDYLRSVVPAEMPASWPAAALVAQATAARSYAAYKRVRASGSSDICDTTACQVYPGIAAYSADGTPTHTYEAATTDAAIVQSARAAVFSQGGLALTEFSASNGGWSTAGGLPYLVARPDPYDGLAANPSSSWTAVVDRSRIAAAWPAVGTPTALVVTSRDGNGEWGGRVTGVRVVGSAGSVTLTGAAFAAGARLKSAWWIVQPRPAGLDLDVSGDGRADLLAKTTTDDLVFYRGRVDGGFDAPVHTGSGWRYLTLFASPGDATRDGVADLWARGMSGDLWLYAVGSDGRPVSQRIIGTGWGSMVDLAAAGDRTGDRVPDLYGKTASGSLWLYSGDGKGGIAGQVQIGSGWSGMDRLLGGIDATGDGIPDLLARQAGTGLLWLYPGVAGGSLLEGRVVGSGWEVFTAVLAVNSPVGGPALLGRLATGELLRYPVLPGGGWGTRSSLGLGWNSVSLFW